MVSRIYVPTEEKERHMKYAKGALIRQREKDGWKIGNGLDVEKLINALIKACNLPRDNIIKYLEELEAKGLMVWDKEIDVVYGSKKLEDEFMQKALDKWSMS